MMRVAVLFLLTACATPKGSPEATLREYLAAVSAQKYDEAYRLMSDDYKRGHDRETFVRELKKAPVQPAKNMSTRTRAEIKLADGEVITLLWEDGHWALAWDPLDHFPQHTPEDALRSFIRALDTQRFDVLLRFVPNRLRGTVNEERLRKIWETQPELQNSLQALRSKNWTASRLSNDEARVAISERRQARLVREENVWKVEALE